MLGEVFNGAIRPERENAKETLILTRWASMSATRHVACVLERTLKKSTNSLVGSPQRRD